ncbi:MAG: peptidoglycan-associated lipoprotein Pal [Candidatus Methylomirabilales bacterium]
MMRRCIRLDHVTMLLGALLILVGCATKPGVQTSGSGVKGPREAPRPQGRVEEEKIPPPVSIREVPVTPGVAGRQKPGLGSAVTKESPLKDVFFDFRESALREDAKQALKDNIQWLKANPHARILIEGHCDERGTNEYNLALGERRAKAIRDFLVAGNIDAKRVSIISYGEERPFVLGHDESAWKWNRRGHFNVVSP